MITLFFLRTLSTFNCVGLLFDSNYFSLTYLSIIMPGPCVLEYLSAEKDKTQVMKWHIHVGSGVKCYDFIK